MEGINNFGMYTPDIESVVEDGRKKIVESILAVYKYCFEFSKGFLVGQELKTKYETVEKTMRRYRKAQESKLDVVRKKLGVSEAEYRKAVKIFEQLSLEELDPSKYDDIVAPKEAEYQSLVNISNHLSNIIQNVKMLTSKIFAKEKSQTMSIIHAHAIYLTLKIISSYIENGQVNIDDEKFTTDVLPGLEFIKNNHVSVFGDFNKDTPIDTIVDFLHPIAEHSADQEAAKSRKGKDMAFSVINNICETYGVEVIKPEKVEGNETEYDVLYAANQAKALGVLAKGKPVKNPDGTYSRYPKNDREIASIVNAIAEARFFLSGITTIMSEEFISKLPIRDDSIRSIYTRDVDRLTKVVFNSNVDDTTVLKLLVSHILMSLIIVDQIPTLMLYI